MIFQYFKQRWAKFWTKRRYCTIHTILRECRALKIFWITQKFVRKISKTVSKRTFDINFGGECLAAAAAKWRWRHVLTKASIAKRPSQRLTKRWQRAQKVQTKLLEQLSLCQLIIKGTFRHERKTSKIRYNYDRKMIRPPFFIIFSGLFTQT